MFGQVPPTPYDLRFRIFGIPVRVHPAFWLVAAIMGWIGAGQRVFVYAMGQLWQSTSGLDLVLIWIGCVFVSILIHELGHALLTRYYGWNSEIVLHFFGGYATSMRHTTWKDIAVSAAGPGAGFILYGIVCLVEYWLAHALAAGSLSLSQDTEFRVAFTIYQMKWINLWWGLINLLPVLPLDGGQISRELCMRARPRDGMDWSLKIAMFVSGGVALYFGMHHEQYGMYPTLLFGYLCYQNFQMYQSSRRGHW